MYSLHFCLWSSPFIQVDLTENYGHWDLPWKLKECIMLCERIWNQYFLEHLVLSSLFRRFFKGPSTIVIGDPQFYLTVVIIGSNLMLHVLLKWSSALFNFHRCPNTTIADLPIWPPPKVWCDCQMHPERGGYAPKSLRLKHGSEAFSLDSIENSNADELLFKTP